MKEVISLAGLLPTEKRHLNLNLALVLVHDLLLSKGGIQAQDGPIKQAVHRHKARVQAEWVEAAEEVWTEGESHLADL